MSAVGIGPQPKRREGDSRSVGSVLRAAGRLALWALVGLLLLRGLAGVLSEPQPATSVAAERGHLNDPATAAFAVRFAGNYLRSPRRRRWLRISHRGPRLQPILGAAQAPRSSRLRLRASATSAGARRSSRSLAPSAMPAPSISPSRSSAKTRPRWRLGGCRRSSPDRQEWARALRRPGPRRL